MQTKRAVNVFATASQMGFPFPDPEQGKWCPEDPGVWLVRFARRRGPANPGILLGCSRSDHPRWHIEFESGLDELVKARCLSLLGL